MKNVRINLVEYVTADGERAEARLVRLGRFDAAFELVGGFQPLRTSQVLPSLKIKSGRSALYQGRATVNSLVDTDAGLLCGVALDEQGISLEMLPSPETLDYETFASEWLAPYRIAPEFKIAIADASILLSNARSWMNQIEIALRADEPDRMRDQGKEFLRRVAPRINTAFNAHLERFEEQCYAMPAELRGAHQNYAWQEWNSFFLCAPFGHRTYFKPLGYAGDYEMMDMIHRNAPEGETIFSQVMHLVLVSGWPAESVRNRLAHMREVLVNETARVVRAGRRARILNLGCGPAREVQEFMQQSALSDHADFTLLDFNEETTTHTEARLVELRRTLGRRTGIKMQQMSVQQILRAAVLENRGGPVHETYDLIYCAGLFDYLSDTTCRALVRLFCHWLVPGGLTVVANMNDSKPFRNFIEFLLDWHLIYRDTRAMWSFCPPEARERAAVIAEPTMVNLFLQVRQPA
jgi:extracellular factor (EF) 3-hydroxypalmitic acid methyl ester biosynthesis protein